MGTSVSPDMVGSSTLPRSHTTPHVRFHDVRSIYAGLSVPGLEVYAERALVLPGVTVVHPPPQGYLRYLNSIGLGAPATNGVIVVPNGTSLIGSVSSQGIANIRELLTTGEAEAIEWFQPGSNELHFVCSELQLPYDEYVWSPTPQLAQQVNDKIWLRRRAARHHLRYVQFPESVIATLTDEGTIYQAVEDLINRYGGVVIKDPNQASGEGMAFIEQSPVWGKKLANSLRVVAQGRPLEIIVEAAHFDHIGLSGQVEIGPHSARFIRTTINQVKHGQVHDGNIITSGDLPGIPHQALENLKLQCLEYAELLRQLGYRGWIGFDFLLTPDKLFMIEANGRVTAAMYPLSVGLQAEANGLEQWAVISTKFRLGSSTGYESFASLLRQHRLLFDGQAGVLPVCPSLVQRGVTMLYAIARTTNQAQGFLEQARQVLH